jgi:hypothetical protein
VRALLALGLGLVSAVGGAAGGPEVNVSRIPGAQAEPAIVVDPANPQVLLAGSNSFREGSMRVYASRDGGATWTRGFLYPPPRTFVDSCASDPGVAIDLRGRQYYSFIRTTPCRTGRPHLFVAGRAGPSGAWGAPKLVAPIPAAALLDDKPAIAVDASPVSPHRNRVYVVWSRLSRRTTFAIKLSRSDDGGRTWSAPVAVSRTGDEETYASVAVARNGTVYVAWDDASTYSLKIARSTDGGAHFGPERKAASFSIVPIPHCGSGTVIPAQLLTCVHANPIVSVDNSRGPRAGRVYVSYARTHVTGVQGIFVTSFDSRLRVLGGSASSPPPVPVAAPPAATRPPPERFWPASAVDPSTGNLWVCFYDTTGDPNRKRVVYTCTVSRDGGGTWAKPVAAASLASDETGPDADARQYGDYEGLAVANGVAHPIWTDSRDLATLREEIYTTALSEADLKPPAPSG